MDEYELIVCLECGELALPWAPVFRRPCTDGGRHGPTRSVTAIDSRDVEPLVTALRSSAEALHGLSDDPLHMRHVFADCPSWRCEKARAVLSTFTQQEGEG